MRIEEAKKRLEVWLICGECTEDKQCYDSYLHSTCEYTDYCDEVSLTDAVKVAISALSENKGDLISREWLQTAFHNFFNGLNHTPTEEDIQRYIEVAPSVENKGEWISIDDVMSVFDDFMCGEVDEEGRTTFLEMLKGKAESEDI